MPVTTATKDSETRRLRPRWRPLLTVLCSVALILIGRAWWAYDRHSNAMAEIDSEIVAGQHAIACRNLERLLSSRGEPDGEILYLLGSCELARGRSHAAAKAWSRIAPGSEFSQKAIEGRMHLLYESGQLAAAEDLIRKAVMDPREDRTALLVLLAPILAEQGRIDEAASLIEARWEHLNSLGEGALEPAIKLVLQSIDLRESPSSVEATRALLERAAGLAPDDDRVWLGLANLAIRTHADEDARRRLDACHNRRPDDVSVWRARLNWGMATNRVDVVKEAMRHLPDIKQKAGQIYRVNAWLARHEGDVAMESRALEMLNAVDPADITALRRLTELAERDGQTAGAAALVHKKDEIERLLARYRKLHTRKQPIRDARELAGLADRLGHRFEARAFLTIAIADNPGRADLQRQLAHLTKEQSPVATSVLP